jgi:hypothetical protein
MRSLLLLFVSIIVVLWNVQTQDNTDPSVLEVREFSWSYLKSQMSDQTQNNKSDPLSRDRVYRQEMQNRNSIENRSRDMSELEDRVARETVNSRPVDLYKYTVNLMNTGTKTIKWVYWDYQFSQPADADNPSHRQFRCSMNLKPNQRKHVEALSLLPPSRVINAQSINTALVEKLIINRIEFADGTSWQRLGWHLPAQIEKRTEIRGPCLPL